MLLSTVPLGGLVTVALLHVWLLALTEQSRPWSVVVPGVLLVVALDAVAASIDWGELLVLVPVPTAVLVTAFALAGAVTGFGPRWKSPRARGYGDRRDGTEHHGQDG